MATVKDYRRIALALEGVNEVTHFEKQAFKTKRKIFATLIETEGIGIALLNPEEQYVFCKTDPVNIYPVPNKWGLKGATCLNIKKMNKSLLFEILQIAYQHAK